MRRPCVLIAVWVAATLERARAQDVLDLFRQALAFEREVSQRRSNRSHRPCLSVSVDVSLSAMLER